MGRIEKLKEYLEINPADSFLKHALALEYIKLGDDEKARSYFNEVLKNQPDYIASYYHLGKLLERSGEPEEAIRTYEKGMMEAKNAGDQHTYNELQAAYEDLVY